MIHQWNNPRHHEESEIEGEELNPYVPLRLGPSLPNYYGDYVRQIFFACGAVILLLSPFFNSAVPALLPFEIAGAVALVILGALTNPTNQTAMILNIFGAIIGIAGYEILALTAYFEGLYFAFIEREAIAIALLAALYFSIKTLRNMNTGRIGKRDSVGDFLRPGGRNMMSPGDGD